MNLSETKDSKRQGTILALCGKGGVGKTSVSAAIVKLLSERGRGKVLAIDADPAVGLASALGMAPRKTVDDIRAGLIKDVKTGKAIDKQELVSRIDYEVFEAIEERGNICFLAIGRPESEGCYCRVNSFLKEVIEATASHFDYVVIDGEAGIEQVNRRVMDSVDCLLLVSDASAKGLNVAGEIRKTAGRTVRFKRAALVLNRIRSEKEAKAAIERSGLDAAGWIPEDDTIRRFDIEGRSILELPPCPALEAVAGIIDRVAADRPGAGTA